MGLLMGLLLLSYVGSLLVRGRALRGFGLPSGVEILVLGLLLGPELLGVVDRQMLEAFAPIATVALGWLALVIGLQYGLVGSRRVPLRRMALGALLAVLCGTAVGATVWALTARFFPLPASERWLLAGGIGAALAGTTRHAALWVVERHAASGKLSTLVSELSSSDDLAPILGAGVVFASAPLARVPFPLAMGGWTAVTVAVGAVLGFIALVLLGSDFRLVQSWGVLLGTSLLGIGITAGAGLSPVLAAFAMGATIASFSRHRGDIVGMTAPSERPALMPALLLAGAAMQFGDVPWLWIVAPAVLVRALVKLFSGALVRALSPDARGAGPALGAGMLSAGTVTTILGLAFALRFPGRIGNTVLVTAAAATLLGELVGPAALTSVLRRVGEVAQDAASPQPARAAPPSLPEATS